MTATPEQVADDYTLPDLRARLTDATGSQRDLILAAIRVELDRLPTPLT